MSRFIQTLLLALIILVGGWALYHRNQIQSFEDAIALASRQLGTNVVVNENSQPITQASDYMPARNEFFPDTQQSNNRTQLPQFQRPVEQASFSRSHSIPNVISRLPRTDGMTIRVASFKLDSQTSQGGNLEATTDICEQFDVVALQNKSGLSISRLVNELNRRGSDYRFVDQSNSNQKFAIIFNQQTVILDGQHWYTVNDPENLFLHKPLVAWFRVRNARSEEAFTFTLANVQLHDRKPDQEMAYLGELFRAIRLDGRQEDDIILAGDFQSSDKQLMKLRSTNSLNSAIIGVATNTRNDLQLDNLLFDPKATIEYTGESGVFDFMKRFNMTMENAFAISRRMPVWAEFAILEGRSPGRAADRYSGFDSNR